MSLPSSNTFRIPFARGLGVSLIFLIAVPPTFSDEVLRQTPTRVVVRDHPKTGKPYVSVVAEGREKDNPLATSSHFKKRPDYRMLDPKVKSGEIPYEGPVSDRKKVYVFAAGLAAVGVAGGAAVSLAAASSATAAAGSASGAGAFGAAGAGVATGTAGVIHAKTRPDPDKPDDFIHTSESVSLE